MSLSVLLTTHQPAPQVAAVLAPLREAADEIVVAVDHRMDQDGLGAYEDLADRLVRFEYSGSDRGLAWLSAQCRGDWVLTLAGDEVASAEVVAALPELCSDAAIRQYWFPMRWVWPDPAHWLDELPWSPDFHNRLLRNDEALWFEGRMHAGARAALPMRYVEAPLYHLDTVLLSADERAAKAQRYAAARPGLVAPGGGELNERYYLPERHARLAPVPVPSADRDRVAAVAGAARGFERRPLRREAVVGLRADIDAAWAGRRLEAAAYRATIRVLGRDHRMEAGQTLNVYVAVRNQGTVTWPHGEERPPEIRVAYHWLDEDGATVVHDGRRTPFPTSVAPGEECVVPVSVVAPPGAGTHELVLDLVHEHVCWFGCEMHVRVAVEGEAA